MSWFSRWAVMIYMTVIMFLGVTLLLFVSHKLPFAPFRDMLFIVYYDPESRFVVGLAAAILLYFNYLFVKSLRRDGVRGKTIAFDNPSGRVTLALHALEDLLRREVAQISEVKDIRLVIKAGKKGLQVNARLTLAAAVNVPEITSRVQNTIKRKIQDTIGLEEDISVAVYVGKILPGKRDVKKRTDKTSTESTAQPAPVPFEGYRA